MPTYNYECSKCGFQSEKILSIKDYLVPTENPCENCQSCGTVQKIIVTAAPTIGEGEKWQKKLSDDHRWAMKQMKKRHPNSTIKDY